jgi:protein-S-isoprenylcysteine O-methyltransferase Ste14
MGLLSADNPRDTLVAWVFVIVQFVLIVAVAVMPVGAAWTLPGWADTAAWWLQLVGVGVLVLALVNLGRSLTPLPTPVPHGQLTVGGLYRLVRHPIYTGIMALVTGVALRSGSYVVVAAATALIGWFMVKARWEEGHLLARYPGYREYARRTARFVPGWPTHTVGMGPPDATAG